MEFLKNHTYFTDSAKKLREQRKLENLREVEQLCTHRCNEMKNKAAR
jgi:hypothetical protein